MYSIFIPKKVVASSFVLVLTWLCYSSALVSGGGGLALREARKKRGRQAVRGNEGERMARKEEKESI